MVTNNRPTQELAELHFHLGQSVEPHILWSIAHEQGIKLPSKDYWEFFDMVTLNKETVTWEDYHSLFHLTELVQSSPVAMEQTVYHVISGAYRANNVTLQEPGFNPVFRNREGERDLDQIILAALRGMERALAEFPRIHAGIMLMLDRRLPLELNEVIVKKAVKYRSRGIVGIDIAGPMPKDGSFRYEEYVPLYEHARANGLKTTVHTGEDGTAEDMRHVIDTLPLDRLNHGFRAYTDPALMETVAKKNLTMCLCPTSNMSVGFIRDGAHLKEVIQALWNGGVKFCVNTDNPSMLRTNMTKEIDLLRKHGCLTEEQILQTVRWAFEASFIPTQAGENLYL